MDATGRIEHPHWAGAAARMADGRLFTDYRPACDLLSAKTTGPNGYGEWERKQRMIATGAEAVARDRQIAAARAAPLGGCVDTMVPELTKRVYAWNGPVEGLAHPAGIGGGRLYLPARLDLVVADPDVVAATTVPLSMMPGAFVPNANLYAPATGEVAGTVGPMRPNRYSVPYGNH
jgi:hypothetical protein